MKADSQLLQQSIQLLKALIATPSFSREEEKVADLIEQFFKNHGYQPQRKHNNVWVKSANFDLSKPTILLNSHHDTVKPSVHYSRNPFQPEVIDGKLYGLGSNDAGGALVCLIAAFRQLEQSKQAYNLILAATAEEEISGEKNVADILPELGKIALGIVGEPAAMQPAIAEKGLLVIDIDVKGKAGHAARNEGDNAIYKALPVIELLKNIKFDKESPLIGPVKLSITQIKAGRQHNVVPDTCTLTLDIRVNECYTNHEVFGIIKNALQGHDSYMEIKARSFRLNASKIQFTHPLVKRCLSLGLNPFGSPTLSDQAVMPFPTLKIGPGQSARSHTADEFIYLDELEEGQRLYLDILNGLIL
ncbi:MAG: M20 family metallo-hydrolase [Flavobacteriales bacterium]